jgi:hypothetical protein
MVYILGLSAFYHDSAACLVHDGEIVAAAQEERFTRKKHDESFPKNAVQFCLDFAGIESSDLDHVAFYDKPLLTFERLLETYIDYAPLGFRSFIKAMPVWLTDKLWTRENIARQTGFEGKILFTEHHESHAASAFYPSPFESAAILTMDGVGEWATSSLGIGRGKDIDLIKELRFPHSIGLLYSAFTYFTGFKVNSGEYKLMGLAPYGEPIYVEKILDNLVDIRDDGSLRLDMSYFDFASGLRMTNRKFADLFCGPSRTSESEITQREMDLARSVQEVTEMVMLRMATMPTRRLARKTCAWPAVSLSTAWAMAAFCVKPHLRTSGYSPLPVTPGELSAPLYRSGINISGMRDRRAPVIPMICKVLIWDRRLTAWRYGNCCKVSERRSTNCPKAKSSTLWPMRWPMARWSAGFRAEWNLGRGPWVTAAFWATPIRRQCSGR